ncbi:phage minor head protein [Phytoactinopolyspora limicola]|uniref:phage minor head protein n=1 Tax=Phytoactinopolyspora limicola TaxID=2715536 RepID=UPI00140E6565|nr:phage minor head protein [Phytoactinopolyspora limicola]
MSSSQHKTRPAAAPLLSRLASLAPALDAFIESASPASKEHATRPLERRLRRGLTTMWAEQSRRLLEHLGVFSWRFVAVEAQRPLVEAGPIPDDALARIWQSITSATGGPLASLLNGLAGDGIRRGHNAGTLDVGLSISFDVDHPLAVDYLSGYGASRVAGIDRTTMRELRSLLAQAAGSGWSYDFTAREIRRRFQGFSNPSVLGHIRDRAELVAVTEIGEAYEHGQWMVIERLREQGIQTDKAWLSAEDARVCDVCEPAAAAGWIPSGNEFPNGRHRPLGHPGCRCALTIRVADQSRVVPVG